MLSIGALRCTAHLLPLLHPLHFIINARNKCVTLTLIVINGSDDPRLFSDSSKLISNQERKYTKIRVIVGTCCLSPPSGITAVPHRHSLLAVCAQWVDRNYQLQKGLLGPLECPFDHSGSRQAGLILKVLEKFELPSKIGWHTGDNTTSNDTCLETIES